MTTQAVAVPLTGPQAVEAVELVVHWPAGAPAAAVLVAHGAGTTREHPSLTALAAALSARGHVVGLANFPFTEAGRRRPDPMARLERAWSEVVTAFVAQTGAEAVAGRDGPPLVLAGRSMGSRVASHLIADGRSAAAGWVAISYPLHPAGRPERLRVDHWPALTVPALLVSGDRDAMAPLDLLQHHVATHLHADRTRLHVVAGGDHSLRVRKRDGRTAEAVAAEVHEAVASWLDHLVAGRLPPGT